MKATKILTSAIVLTTLGLTAAQAAQAADVHTETYTSHGKVGFIENTDPTNPVDPTDPTKPVDPTDPDNPDPGTKGPLSIDYVSNFDFGIDHKVSGNDEIYYAKPVELLDKDGKKIIRANYLQVTDQRGTNAGWKLSVNQTAQFNDGTADLDGASLKMSQQVLNSTNMDATTTPGVITPVVTVTPDGADVKVLKAEKGQGMGTWTDAFGTYDETAPEAGTSAKAVSLDVPGKSAKNIGSTYKTDLVWTLTDAGM